MDILLSSHAEAIAPSALAADGEDHVLLAPSLVPLSRRLDVQARESDPVHAQFARLSLLQVKMGNSDLIEERRGEVDLVTRVPGESALARIIFPSTDPGQERFPLHPEVAGDRLVPLGLEKRGEGQEQPGRTQLLADREAVA